MDAGKRNLLFSPGPVHIDPSAWAELQPIHHRTREFREISIHSGEMLASLAGSTSTPFFLTMSGTGAMEAAIANLTVPGDRVLSVSGGKFGARWHEIAVTLGCKTEILEFTPGEGISPAVVRDRASQISPDFITLTHVESSTGLLIDLKEIIEALPEPRPVVILDAVASMGSELLLMDEWGVDLAVGAGQKALAAPPGISFVIAGERAARLYRENTRRLYYNSFIRYEKSSKQGDTPFTPAVQGIQLIHRSLEGIFGEGPSITRDRHARHSRAFLEAVSCLGFGSFPEDPSASVQALALPRGVSDDDLLDYLYEAKGITVAAGQGELKGRIIRTGFLGLHKPEAIRSLVEGMGRSPGINGSDKDLECAFAAIDTLLAEGNNRPGDLT